MRILKSRADIEKKHVDSSIQLNKSWKISAVADINNNTNGINKSVSLLQQMNEDICLKEKNLAIKLDTEGKRIEVEVIKKIELFIKEMELKIKKMSVNKKKLQTKEQESWKQWGNKLLDMIRIMRTQKKPKGELYSGLCNIVESVEIHCQAQRELAAGICQAWVELTKIEALRATILTQAIQNAKQAFEGIYIFDNAQEQMQPEDNEINKTMDITQIFGENEKNIIGAEISLEKVFSFLEKQWDAGWESIANEFIISKSFAKVMIIGKAREVQCNLLLTIENYLVCIEENKQKPECVFRLEMAKCRIGEQGKALELTELNTGIFYTSQKLILRFDQEQQAQEFHQLIHGCVENL